MMKLLVLGLCLGLSFAACPNKCSGHGSCGGSDLCSCQPRWMGADCSERECAYGLSWTTEGTGITPAGSGLGGAHKYAECSSKGVCDRTTGECACFAGYDGRGCRRQACPSGCSGHGRCLYAGEATSSYAGDLAAAYSSQFWDSSKTRQCACDRGWEGVDCASRKCPKGDDPLTDCGTSASGDSAAAHDMVQRVVVQLKPTESQMVDALAFGTDATSAGATYDATSVLVTHIASTMCGAPVVQYKCNGDGASYGAAAPFLCDGMESVLATGTLLCNDAGSASLTAGDMDTINALTAATASRIFVARTSTQAFAADTTAAPDIKTQVRVGVFTTSTNLKPITEGGEGLIVGDTTSGNVGENQIDSVYSFPIGCVVGSDYGLPYPAQFENGLCDDMGDSGDHFEAGASSTTDNAYWGYISLKYTDMFGGEYFTRPILIDSTAMATQGFPVDVSSTPTSDNPVAASLQAGSAHPEWQWEYTKSATVSSASYLTEGSVLRTVRLPIPDTSATAGLMKLTAGSLTGNDGNAILDAHVDVDGTSEATSCMDARARDLPRRNCLYADSTQANSMFDGGYGYEGASVAVELHTGDTCMVDSSGTFAAFGEVDTDPASATYSQIVAIRVTVPAATALLGVTDLAPGSVDYAGACGSAFGNADANAADDNAGFVFLKAAAQGVGGAMGTLGDSTVAGKRSNTLRYTADRIRAALQDLPNFAIPSVNVTNAMLPHPDASEITACQGGSTAIEAAGGAAECTPSDASGDWTGHAMWGNVFDITFTDSATTGAQPMLECYYNSKRGADGAFPRMNNIKATTTYVDDCWVEEVDATGRVYEETTECSNRGVCNGATGVCECFEGHTGEACATQNIFF